MKLQTKGISPKLTYSIVVGLLVFATTKLAIDLDPILEQATNVAAILATIWQAPPGQVESVPTEDVPDGGDEEI